MSESKYYSCDYLLTLKDANGLIPDIYIVDGNRTAGKSVSMKKRIIDTFLKHKTNECQFMYLYRNKIDMKNVAETFFDDIKPIYYPEMEMTDKTLFNGAVVELSLDGIICGYAVPLSISRKLKRMRALFINVGCMFFDEYQDEDNMYLPGEVGKLFSIHTTVASGNGKQSRRVPLYMASNTVSMLNPYYSALGINKLLRSNTKILRGDGWVFEKTFNTNAQKEFQNSAFNRAFSKSSYYKYASENVYLNDNTALISKPSGHSEYFLSIRYNGEWYNVRKYNTCVYVSEGYDQSFPRRVTFQVSDVIDDRAMMVTNSNYIVMILRSYFHTGIVRFDNLKSKNMLLDMLAYT